VPESITITDNRNGESVEIPISGGAVDGAQWRKHLGPIWFHDPAFGNTAATDSAITELDGEAVPKVIDFGVAKALGQQLTEKTLFTR